MLIALLRCCFVADGASWDSEGDANDAGFIGAGFDVVVCCDGGAGVVGDAAGEFVAGKVLAIDAGLIDKTPVDDAAGLAEKKNRNF